MYEEFDSNRRAYIIRDPQNIVRQIIHQHQPFITDAKTNQEAGRAYLDKNRDLFGINPEELKNLELFPENELIDAGVEYRLLEEKTLSGITTVSYHQTYFGLPVWEAGLSIYVTNNGTKVISSISTIHQDLKVNKPNSRSLKRFLGISASELISIFKLRSKQVSKDYDLKSLKVNKIRLIIYRYEKKKRLKSTEEGKVEQEQQQLTPVLPTLPLPPVADSIEEGQHYVSAEIYFTLPTRQWGLLNWIAIIEIETASVLYLRALVDNVDGMVFTSDPTSQGSAATTSSNDAVLNPLRSTVPILGLDPPSGGDQSLIGPYVRVRDHESPPIGPPTESVGTNFNYNVRSNDFAAVNCYYHCDSIFRLIIDLGFDIDDYFDGTAFPVSFDHRGRINSTDGIEINASCGGNATGNGIGLPDFALLDLSDTVNPLGIAVSKRVALHELLGHGILWDHVNSPNLGFAHSAGDSFAAILSDPDSQAPDRFLTYPFSPISRRHDRAVGSGWAWDGNFDSGGYNSEQILCTTHFRIYRAIGGDSSRVESRRFAARYMAYLMLKAISLLSPVGNPSYVSGFTNTLITADWDDWIHDGHAGHAYGKVIRWAFEKQGLYQPVGAPSPVTSEGAAPAVDVYIDDGRHGEYQYQANHWSCQNIWNRVISDGGTAHQQPIVGITNYAYVKIKNRGSQIANNVIVRGFHCEPGSGLIWPDNWQAMTTSQLSAPNVPPNNSAEITVGPFQWVPSQAGHECMLMIVSANGDSSNIDWFSVGDSIPEWRLVPHDNNIGQRNVVPVPAGGGWRPLLAAFAGRKFVVHNPHPTTARIEIIPTLPKLLQEKGWEILFENADGNDFSLPSRQHREIVIRLKSGADFSAEEVEKLEDRTVQFHALANGILVGGMSYELDPSLRELPPEYPDKDKGSEKCSGAAKDLLDCFNFPVDKVKSVRIRMITVDIEIQDDCDDCD